MITYRQSRRQWTLASSLLIFAALLIYATGCESKKDPFSAKNVAPAIAEFFFQPDQNLPNIGEDSLKFKAGEQYKLRIEYNDPEFASSETQTLEASFDFVSGSGTFSHDQFEPIGTSGKRFRVPATFSDDVLFSPDASGLVRIELTLSDGVKSTETPARTSAIFFENLAPIPSFSSRALNQVNPYRFEFNPSTSRDRDGTIESYIWNFGDNTPTETVLNNSVITHEYNNAGQYRVILKLVDNEGKIDSTEQAITTSNQRPVANLSIDPDPSTGKAPFTITYNAGSSFYPDGSIASYLVSFADGSTAQTVSGSHTYVADGSYRVLLIVRDNLGLADSTSKQIQVSTPPNAVLNVTPRQGAFPLEVDIDAAASNDPFGGDLDYEIFIDNQLTYTGQNKVSHVFDTPRVSAYIVRLRVTSQRTGLSDEASEAVTVKNTPPVANFTFFPTKPQATVDIRFDASTSFDPDSTDAITNYQWNWGDGSQPQTGAGLVTVIHEYLNDGEYLVRLTVTDRFGGTSAKTDTVRVSTQ